MIYGVLGFRLSMERRVVCVSHQKGSRYDDCRAIAKVGYELRDGVYERSPEYINRRIDDGEEFYIETDDGKLYLEAAQEGSEDDEEEDEADEDDEDEDDEDVLKYVRTEDEDTPDDPLLHIEECS